LKLSVVRVNVELYPYFTDARNQPVSVMVEIDTVSSMSALRKANPSISCGSFSGGGIGALLTNTGMTGIPPLESVGDLPTNEVSWIVDSARGVRAVLRANVGPIIAITSLDVNHLFDLLAKSIPGNNQIHEDFSFPELRLQSVIKPTRSRHGILLGRKWRSWIGFGHSGTLELTGGE